MPKLESTGQQTEAGMWEFFLPIYSGGQLHHRIYCYAASESEANERVADYLAEHDATYRFREDSRREAGVERKEG